jgi:hypothetical protein
MDMTFGSLSLYVVGAILSAYIFGSIFRKAGYSGWLALLMFVPLVNGGVLLWFATTTWPLERAANAGQGKTDKVDVAYELKTSLRRALTLEKAGKWDQAVKEFSHVVHLADGAPNANLAQEHIQQIEARRTTGIKDSTSL